MSLPPWTMDLLLGVAAVGIAAVVIGLFMRSTRSGKEQVETSPPEKETLPEQSIFKQVAPADPPAGMSLKSADVEKARTELNLLALERDILSMAISKFFEAEDEGEISGEDRARLSKEYEARMKMLSDRMKRSDLIVGLYELEKIRDELVKRYNARLSETNAKIEELQGELKLTAPVEEKKPPAKKRRVREKEETEAKPRQRRRPRGSEIDEKIEKLRQEVLKELEELEKLEIEA